MGLRQPRLHNLFYFVIILTKFLHFKERFVELPILHFLFGHIQFTQLTYATICIDVSSIGFGNAADEGQFDEAHGASPDVVPEGVFWGQDLEF